MPKTITKEVYSYKELCELKDTSKEMQRAYEKARDWMIEGVTQFDWYDCTMEDWTEKLAEIGFLDAKIHFRGFWSQGDGACFDADCDVSKLLEGLDHKFAELNYEVELSITIEKNNSAVRYCHEKTRYIDIDSYQQNRTKEQESLMDNLEQIIEENRLDLCREIYSDLEKEYEYRTSDEALIEDAEANEWMFNDRGGIEYA